MIKDKFKKVFFAGDYVDYYKIRMTYREVQNFCKYHPMHRDCPFYNARAGKCSYVMAGMNHPCNWRLDELSDIPDIEMEKVNEANHQM